ncbi:MAG: 23S rRNA (uracil(1939)-C(5))-methyltransferase RlmD [Pseudomonadota bacterium]|nr:23S rRNA (uracil(1939)-C(5))-methyltransferase RlmD [Pseudomonadota bacterium]
MARRGAAVANLTVISATGDGSGVARHDGKVCLVEGALAGEEVDAVRIRGKARYDVYRCETVTRSAPDRVEPRCAVYGRCGGCVLQHQSLAGQVADKQTALLDKLQRLGGVAPETVYDPILGPEWHYRARARLGVKFVMRKERVLIGFRERRTPYLTDMAACEILDARVARLLPSLCDLIARLSVMRQVPQIEVAAGEGAVVLVLRHLAPLTGEDRTALSRFGDDHGIIWYLQQGGPDTIEPLLGSEVSLTYRMPDFSLSLGFSPALFSQVNPAVNQRLVSRVVELLEPQSGERIADLFCGIGNFTLALARSGAQVFGYEGELALVQWARDNATANALSHHARCECVDLFAAEQVQYVLEAGFDKLLLDPPRTGADAVCRALARQPVARVVYVSCNPATLARDAATLTANGAYRLVGAGHVDMFPHTAHGEAVTLFEAIRD